jgi:hypothetical protein
VWYVACNVGCPCLSLVCAADAAATTLLLLLLQMKHLVDHLTGRLLGYVAVHSGEWALYTPWDSKPAYGPGLPVRSTCRPQQLLQLQLQQQQQHRMQPQHDFVAMVAWSG